jgi:1-acyl-sn-glycerol-3-phosphate acyltransferase
MGTWAKMVFFIMGKRLNIVGRKHLDKSRNYILLANHSSMFDITAIMTFYPGVSWFGHERLLKIPLLRKMLLMTDYIPMTLKNVSLMERSVHFTGDSYIFSGLLKQIFFRLP